MTSIGGGINFIVVCLVPAGGKWFGQSDQWFGQIIGNAPTREVADEILGRVQRNPRYRYQIGEVTYE